jgi:hypothetical protein
MPIKITLEQKKSLSKLIGEGHRHAGFKVLPRRPYYEGEGGEGTPFKEHPLLGRIPDGASSDLTFLAIANIITPEKAAERAEQATPELRQRLENALGAKLQAKEAPKLSPLG